MTKWIGVMLIIGVTTIWGWVKAEEIDRTYEELHYIRRILYLLQSEIQYSRAFLAEAFCHIGKKVKEPYSVWMRQMYCRMERRKEGDFETIWRQTMEQYLSGVPIPENVRQYVRELGQYLGTADINTQVRHITLLVEQIETTQNDMKENLRSRKRLCRCLGVMSGIFLAVILV